MENQTWTSELETGITTIDCEHRALLDLINHVIVASENSDLAELKSSLKKLQTAIDEHFAREEQLMIECAYEASVPHQEEHQQLAREIQNQISELDADKINVGFIARFMRNWLLQHIVTKDAHFGEAVRTQNGATDRRQDNEEGEFFYERRMGNMEPIDWTPSLTLGIEAIDASHRAIIGTLNAIIAARHTADRANLAKLLEQLGNETAGEFEVEEALMKSCGYDNTKAHTEEHRKFLDEFSNQIDEWREHRISSELLCRFMYHWLGHHIADLDTPLAEAIRKTRR